MAVNYRVNAMILPGSPTMDEVGPCYDLKIIWVPASLPVGSSDPDGKEYIIEISAGNISSEAIRDEIRDGAVSILNALPGFASASLTREDVLVFGADGIAWSNEGDSDLPQPSPPVILYGGPAFRPNIPTLINTPLEEGGISSWHTFDNSLNEDLKDDSMTILVYFDTDPILTKLQYRLLGYSIAGSLVWSQNLALVSHIASAVVDLTLIGQDILWTTGAIRFALGLVRTTGGYDIPPDASGIIRQAVLAFTRL